MTRSKLTHEVGPDRFFSTFSHEVARWTGSHWAFLVAAMTVVVSLAAFGIELTNVAISIVTLLMVFVLQNTQNRDSAALHLKLDEIVRAVEGARDDVRGVESRSEPEIRELTHEDDTVGAGSEGRR
jgi:low affinity Fe/Cu permease